MTLTRAQRAYKAARPPLTAQERDVLYGMLLGDAFACRVSPRGDAHVCIKHSAAQKVLVDHLFALFAGWTWMACPRADTTRCRGHTYACWRFTTFTHPVFTELHQMFYRPTGGHTPAGRPQYVKHIPDVVERWLTPRVLAYQVMCDGSYWRRRLRLHTQSFTPADQARYLAAVNARFGLHGQVQAYWDTAQGRSYTYLIFPAADLPRLRTLLLPDLLPMFRYKLGLRDVDVVEGADIDDVVDTKQEAMHGSGCVHHRPVVYYKMYKGL